MRCRTDPELFARFFFPHHCRLPFSSMHREFFRSYRHSAGEDLLARTGYREVVAAPRGFAKSTVKTLIIPLHAILYGTERYIVIVSATLKQAKLRLKNIKNEILTNDRIKEYFKIPIQAGQKRSWTQQAINALDVQLEAYSAGTEIRGISHHEFRPTRIILDDAEDSSQVESAEGRDKLLEWFNEVIENLGDSYTIIDVIGTILHPESLLSTLLRRPDFRGRVYSAVMDFAGDEILWEKWRARFTNLSDQHRIENARRFFLKNRNAMLKGSRVLWGAKEDYYTLMVQMTTMGRSAFFQEKQNDPRTAGERIFSRDRFRYFSMEGGNLMVERSGQEPKQISLSSLSVFGFLDSALGKGKGKNRRSRGDFAAIVSVGRDAEGYVYVLDAWLSRVPPTKQIERLFDLHERFHYTRFGVEGNCFQSLLLLPLEQERGRRREEGKAWDVAVSEVNHREKKEARILSLEPLVANGWIRFNRALPEEFFRQMEDVPRGLHDDGPDALAACFRLSRCPGKGGLDAPGGASRKRKMRCQVKYF